MISRSIKYFALVGGMLAGTAFSAPQTPPVGLDELPPGRVKEKIQSLPPAAQQRALEWLERLSIPEQDYENIDIDNTGGVFYIEDKPGPGEIEQGESTDDTSTTTSESITATEAFSLHSKPGATKIIYLDFDGHEITDTAWNGTVKTYYAKPFDRDSDLYTFSASELTDIAEIWLRVAEDYAAFDVDVTTEVPSSMGPETGRILITASVDETGTEMPYSTAGGVAYVGVWGNSDYEYYQPALVYYDNLGGAPRYISEAASHEMGHNQGLSHDGTSSSSYYSGHGSGYTSWAPIMGVGYGQHVTQWNNGDYPDANNTQDDVAILAGNLAIRADDHGDSISSASLLSVDSSGNVVATNPETDPTNTNTDNKGIIASSSDVDVFQIDAGDGDIQLTATPAWDAYTNSKARGANLDIKLTLLDSNGTTLAVADDSAETESQISYTVADGIYYLAVTGVGDTPDGDTYSDYGSHGLYFINGSVPVSGSSNTAPVASDDSATTLEDQAVTIDALANDSDDDGDSLTITLVSNGSLGSATTDGSVITYTPEANANGSDTISYSIDDGQGGSDSASVSIVIDPVNDAPVAVDDSLTVDQDTSGTVQVLANDSDVDEDSLTVVSVTSPSHGTAAISGNEIVYTPDAGYSGSDSFSYTIDDGNGATASATVAVTVSDVTSDPVTPSGLTATDGTDGTALLSWTDTDNEEQYELQRETKHNKRNMYKNTVTVATLSADVTAYTDAAGEGTHRYRIRTHNSVGTSAWSDWVYVTVSDSTSGGNNGKGVGNGKNK